jgi:hypothetical protein
MPRTLGSAAAFLRMVEAEARKAIALSATRISAYRMLAATDVAMARWDALEADLKRARTAVPDDLGAEYAAAKAILDRSVDAQSPSAERYLRDYLSQPNEGLEPDMATAHWQLGVYWRSRAANRMLSSKSRLRSSWILGWTGRRKISGGYGKVLRFKRLSTLGD